MTLKYPSRLHDEHKDLPFCPTHQKPPGSKHKKLLTTLEDKTEYVIHYAYLKQALENGLELEKILRGIKFKQSMWLKRYIDKNSDLRKVARNDFEKNFYKLMNNSIYEKTMENVRKRSVVKLANKWRGKYGAEYLISKPNFQSCSIFTEDLVAIQLRKLEVTIDKPLYIGLCVLDLSKIVLYEFWYNFMKVELGDKVKLLYTDTDSLIVEIEDHDVYEIMKKFLFRFDTSDYPICNWNGMPHANKKNVGLMKDECAGKLITEFLGLRSKMYCVIIEFEDVIKKVKGVKKNVIQNTIFPEHFKQCLFEQDVFYREQFTIRSHFHQIYTEKQRKVALNASDDKRYLIPESQSTLPWGHRDIPT